MKDVLKMIRFDYISVKPLTVPYVIGFIAVCLVLSLFGIPLGVFCFAASAAVFAPVQEQASSDTRKIYGILPVRRDAVTKAAFLEMTVPLFIGELLSLTFLLISNFSKLYRIFPKIVVGIIEELFDFSQNDANIAFGELCIIKLCVLAAIVSIYALLAKNSTGLDKFRYIFNIAGNALTVLVIAYFDIYKFWGC